MRRSVLWFACGLLAGVLVTGLLPSPDADPVQLDEGVSAAGTRSEPRPPMTVELVPRPSLNGTSLPTADTEPGPPVLPDADPDPVRGGKPRWDASGASGSALSGVHLVVRACRAAATGRTPEPDEVSAWLMSRDQAQLRLGIGWALRVTPACMNDLLRLARDASHGIYAAVALTVLSSDPEARALVRDDLEALARSRDPLMQRAVLSVLPRFGEEGLRLASSMARRGDLSPQAYELIAVGLDAAGRASLAEAALDAGVVPPALARHILKKDGATLLRSYGPRRLVEELAEAHPDAWVRSAARQLLARGDGDVASRTLIIRTALYGARGKVVDVSSALRGRVKDGRLLVWVTNGLAGDPVPGATKELVVEYEFAGRRFVRTTREGSRLQLP